MQLALTYLFVPGDRPDRFDKAAAAGANAVILDLEDAVAPDAKGRAREAIGEWLARHSEQQPTSLLRINDSQSPWWADDLAFLARIGAAGVMLPKAESAAQVDAVVSALPAGASVIPLIETARGVHEVDNVAAANGVQRLAFGTLDYAVDLGIDAGDERALLYPASRIVVASRCTGIAAPIAGVTPAIDDEEQLRSDLAFERALGFGAKLAIHPRQIGVIRDAFLPSAAEVQWARKILAAVDGARGAVQLDGRMVDRPVITKAQAILARVSR